MALWYASQLAAAGYVVAVGSEHLVMIGEKGPEDTMVPIGGGSMNVVRYSEYSVAGSSPPVTLLVFEMTEAEDGGECYYEEETGTWEHVVDVQTDHDVFIVFVSVSEDNSIVGIRTF